MSNCPNCLAINPFKKVHRDGAEIEICEYCNTIKEEEYEEYPKKQVQNKDDADKDKDIDIDIVPYAYIFALVFVFLVIAILNN